MSIADRFARLMERSGEQNQDKEDVPFLLKYGARIAGTVGGAIMLLAGLLGLFNIVVLSISPFMASVLEAIFGFVVVVCESPCCFVCIDFVPQISDFVDNQPKWLKAVTYLVIPVMFFLRDAKFGSFLEFGLVFVSGALYGMMALGKKADINEMTQTAAQTTSRQTNIKQDLKSKLIPNAFTMSFTGITSTDSNV